MEIAAHMFRKSVQVVLVVTFVCLILFFLGTLIFRFDTGGGLHTYAAFGNGRFDIWVGGEGDENRSLHDNELIGFSALVAKVERYLEKGDRLYVTGYHSYTRVDRKNPRSSYRAFVTNSDESLKYNSFEEVPKYLILNLRTAEMQLYRTFDEIPEDQRQYFTQKLNWWCDLMRTCYEAK